MTTTMPSSARIFRSRSTTAPTSPTPLPSTSTEPEGAGFSDLNKVKSLPLDKQVLVTTGSQGEEMSALYRMAFSQHRQIDVGPGDRVIISASAIPGNEKTIGRVINELFRKGVDVIYDKSDPLHVSGHACQEELKIIHALTKPRFFIPLHGEQKMLRRHMNLAMEMGMDRKNIVLPEIGIFFLSRKKNEHSFLQPVDHGDYHGAALGVLEEVAAHRALDRGAQLPGVPGLLADGRHGRRWAIL